MKLATSTRGNCSNFKIINQSISVQLPVDSTAPLYPITAFLCTFAFSILVSDYSRNICFSFEY